MDLRPPRIERRQSVAERAGQAEQDAKSLAAAEAKVPAVQAGELSEYRFVTPGEALRLLNRSLGRRVTHALRALRSGGDVYLEA